MASEGNKITLEKDLNEHSSKNSVGSGLPDLLPVIRQSPTIATLAPTAGYILVPATAVGIRTIAPATISGLQLIATGNAQRAGTIVLVRAPTATVVQNRPASSSEHSPSPTLQSYREDNPSGGSANGNIVDDASIRQSMGRNRESLKRKLLQRRSVRELVDRGILPPPKTPPSYYEQRIKLERAKMGDILKHKIEHRPGKQQLVSQHILLDSCADPGILEKQQQLKRCKLADSLNEKLASRPGPLELVQENILHVDAALEQAIKDGRLQFKPTSAGLIQKRPQPVFLVTHESEAPKITPSQTAPDCPNIRFDAFASQSHSLLNQAPMDLSTPDACLARVADPQSISSGTASGSTKPKPKKNKAKVRAVGVGAGNKNMVGKSSATKQIRLHDPSKRAEAGNIFSNLINSSGGTLAASSFGNGQIDPQSFARGITQFNPVDQKGADQETSYDLLLQQQQLLLQWQHELQQKYPNSTVQLVSLSTPKFSNQQHFPVNYGATTDTTSIISSIQSSPGTGNNGGCGLISETPTPLSRSGSDGCTAVHGSTGNKPPKRLEDMKVSDLKMECKKRNLPVSGSKSNIVDRLKCYEDVILAAHQPDATGSQADPAGLDAVFPQSPLVYSTNSTQGQQGGALPPISFLCGGSTAQTNFNPSKLSSPSYQSNVQPFAAEVGAIYVNRSSSSSDFASNYSSPGIDLSSLNFGAGASCSGIEDGQMVVDSTSKATATTTTTEQYTFSTPNFGAQFLVTSAGNNPFGNDSEQTAVAMDTTNLEGTNTVRGQPFSSASAPSLRSVTDSPQPGHQHERLPFLQAANTLVVHEEALRQQQKKIEEIQKELQRSQDLLRQQQQMILAAKRLQAEATETPTSDADSLLNQLDTKQIQKAHIQIFLQQKIQQQQLQQQINVQQELMEIQQKLQEEMTVHQALNEVVRLLRQEPRVSILVLHLLRRHQMEQHSQQQSEPQFNRDLASQAPSNHRPQHSRPDQPNPSLDFASDGDELKRGDLFSPICENGLDSQQQPYVRQCNGTMAPSPVASLVRKGRQVNEPSQPPTVDAQSTSSDGSNNRATKNRQGSGQHPKKEIPHPLSARASSMPTSPMKSKYSSTGDMEEIFRTVLEYATKATENIFDGRVPVSQGQQQSAGLPSFDQLLRPVSEIETAITITNGSGILMTSAIRDQEQLSLLDHLPKGPSTASKDPTADKFAAVPSTSFMYTRNEAFDDLMEVLRNNEAAPATPETNNANSSIVHEPNRQSASNAATSSHEHRAVSQAHQQLNLLSAFGAQEVADLLGTEWFNVDSLFPQPACSVTKNDGLSVAAGPDLNAFGVSVLSSGRIDMEGPSRPVDHSGDNPRGSVVLVSADMAEQMDWLDLILPSPSSGSGNALHDLPVMNCLPVDVDTGAVGNSLACRTDSLLAGSRDDFGIGPGPALSSTHNPVLAMSACSSEAL